MNNKKTFRKAAISTMAASAAVAAIAPAASAAETEFSDLGTANSHYDNIMALAQEGVISGYQDGTFRPYESINRGQVAAMLTKALELKTPENMDEVLKVYSDVNSNSDYAKEIAAVTAAGIFSGKDGKFNTWGNITREQMATALVLGFNLEDYNTKEDVPLNTDKISDSHVERVQILANLEITNQTEDFKAYKDIQRDQFATFVKLAQDVVNAEEAAPAVESVSAINPTTVKVNFNKAVAASDAEGTTSPSNTANLSKYSVGGTNPTSAKLSEDGKTATLTFASSVEGKNLAVVVEPITLKADDNVKTERYAEVLTYKDTVKAEVSKVESVTGGDYATTVKVTFSEPVDSYEAVKLNGQEVAAGNLSLSTDGYTLDITGQNLDASKNQTLDIINLTDKATEPNVTSHITKTFKPVIDTEAPTVSSVKAKSDTALVFEFSKPVDLDAEQASTYVKLFDEDLTDVSSTLLASQTFSEVTGSNGTKFEVNLDATPFGTNETTKDLTAQVSYDTANPILDLQGNKLAKTTKNITINKDVTAPSLNNSKYRLDNDGKVKELSFTFDEDVDLASGVTTLADLLDSDVVNNENGVKTPLATELAGLETATLVAKDNVITATLVAPIDFSGKYSFDMVAGKVEDKSLATNTNKAKAFTLDFGAASVDETFKVDAGNTTATGNVITVKFDEAVKGGAGANSATSLSAYKLNGKALPTGTTITLNAAQDEATITLPEGSIKDSDSAAIFVADSIVSKDGKKNLEKYTGTVSIDDNVAPELTNVQLTGDNDLLVTFSEAVQNEDIADFEIEINDQVATGTTGTPLTITPGTGSDAGKFVINLSDLVEVDSVSGDTVVNLTDSNNITVATGADVTSTFKYASSSKINSIVVNVKDGNRTTNDTEGNTLKPGTQVRVK
ncbi:S-layer homology domain-containing protein [Virgibacillus halodenitrificans]|uniref:S-layer homology domain-containing protein n=1 Tax=Virgibacillus halodenitrificans TaxID=1482 RepID=UPI001F3FD574|nr:S-layer homology domain-containing protein [Virgibacillus halodenitrificans]MCG1027010.1 S-layer homology domain-containing protein [Virgibacillus halodenitrificans]